MKKERKTKTISKKRKKEDRKKRTPLHPENKTKQKKTKKKKKPKKTTTTTKKNKKKKQCFPVYRKVIFFDQRKKVPVDNALLHSSVLAVTPIVSDSPQCTLILFSSK